MWKERFLTLLRANPLAFIFSSLGLLLILIGIASMVLSENKSQGVIIEEAASTERVTGQIIVDVSGAVLKPGVYKLTSGARLQEALIAAGGLASGADREYLSKSLNLAAKLSDGAKIYVPSVNERPVLSNRTGLSSVAGLSTGLINVNTASQSELESLPGIGVKTAQKIIANRPYSSVEDLLTKKVVGQKVFEEIREKITVY